VRRSLIGSLTGVASLAVLSGALLPLRSSVSIATVGLVLVIPVVVAVVAGGLLAGAVAVASGFLVYDFVFIPPYYTLSVGAAQNWAALGVYVVVMAVVARVVSRLQQARAEAQRRAADAQRLLELSELLVAGAPETDTVPRMLDAVRTLLGADGVALLVGDGRELSVRATAGRPPEPSEWADLRAGSGRPVPIGLERPGPGLRTLPLVSSGRPVGVLALRQVPGSGIDRDLLQIFVNQVAVAIERAELRDRAVRTQVLEEADRVRRALLGAVSHDLRTPLATLKVASSSLLYPGGRLDEAAKQELYVLLDTQVDRLDRLVTGLLDMNRYQSGALALHLDCFEVADLVQEALSTLGPVPDRPPVEVRIAPGVGAVRADRVLVSQVVVNLLDNAQRHSPPGVPVRVQAGPPGAPPARAGDPGVVVVAVEDAGPGVPAGEQEAVFARFQRSGRGGRAGLGLWICRTFVEAHGQRIWVEDAGPGARFCFTLAAA
jgi:two-component system sensor histidine kinase KdpD